MSSAGRPIDGVEVRILDPRGNLLPPGEIGEIVLRSRANMRGYWKLPDVTNATITADGWLRTGDAGYLDEDGYIFIQDRIKDVIISGGENVYPAEIERVLVQHPSVAEAVVFGIPDPKWGEAAHAVIVPRHGTELDYSQLRQWLRERLAGFKVPKSFTLADSLPRNSTGKVMRRALRAPYWAGESRHVS
jgi:acyl-CoA synthetase (AMP-forming)/AMP-acid ligase II